MYKKDTLQSAQSLSRVQLCDSTDCSMPGFPVHHQFPELTQIHIHPVGEAIQPSHPLLSPSPPPFNLSQHQGLFQWVNSLHQVAKELELQFQHQSFQRIFRTDFLWDWLVWPPYSPRDSQESSPTPQFKSINSLKSVKRLSQIRIDSYPGYIMNSNKVIRQITQKKNDNSLE